MLNLLSLLKLHSQIRIYYYEIEIVNNERKYF